MKATTFDYIVDRELYAVNNGQIRILGYYYIGMDDNKVRFLGAHHKGMPLADFATALQTADYFVCVERILQEATQFSNDFESQEEALKDFNIVFSQHKPYPLSKVTADTENGRYINVLSTKCLSLR